MARMPISPAPTTTTRSPVWISLILAACMATAAGSTMAAASNETASGSWWSRRAGTTTYSAIAPSRRNAGVETPKVWRVSHRFVRPRRHGRQAPHQTMESKVTRAPGAHPSVPGPTASITPDASWPMTTGGMRRPVVPV
jgi:hypothetical protein